MENVEHRTSNIELRTSNEGKVNGERAIADGKWQMANGKERGGFTFVDSLIVVVIVLLFLMLIVGLWIPALAGSGRPPPRMSCVFNLKQVGLAYRMWANDNAGAFPMVISKTSGGAMEYNETGEVFRQFLALADVISTPAWLACPGDGERKRATNWVSGFGNQNVSYFVGLEAADRNPQTILCGDRNITGGVLTKAKVMLCRSNTILRWTEAIHHQAGNIALGDGSVQQVTDQGLQKQLQAEFQSVTNEVIRLAIP